jgi:hypothetical protein
MVSYPQAVLSMERDGMEFLQKNPPYHEQTAMSTEDKSSEAELEKLWDQRQEERKQKYANIPSEEEAMKAQEAPNDLIQKVLNIYRKLELQRYQRIYAGEYVTRQSDEDVKGANAGTRS